MTTKLSRHGDPSRLGFLALAAAAVGLLAGLVAATFALVAGEPVIDDAIAIEETKAATHFEAGTGDAHERRASVARGDQRGIGLFGAYAVTGVVFGALLALTTHGLRRGRPDVGRRALLAGALLAGAFTVAPWLKYPPNPPAVGDASTLGDRQSLYLAVIGIAMAVGLGAATVGRRLRAAGWAEPRRMATIAAAVAVPMLVAFALLPPAPDDVALPATLVWRFRVASLGTNLTLWAVLTLGVGWLVDEAARRPAGDDSDHRPVRSPW